MHKCALPLGQYFLDAPEYGVCADIPTTRDRIVQLIKDGQDIGEITIWQRVEFPSIAQDEELPEGYFFVVVEEEDLYETPEFWVSEALFFSRFSLFKNAKKKKEIHKEHDEKDSIIICVKRVAYELDVKIDET